MLREEGTLTMLRSDRAAVNRRRLRSALRAFRAESGQTQRQVASALDWTPTKLMRIEGGQVGVSVTDLNALLAFYKVSDQELLRTLKDMARKSAGRTLSAQYHDGLSKAFADFLEQEEAAAVIRQFENNWIAGPLQTPDYARVAIRNGLWPPPTEGVAELVETRVEVRVSRGEFLRQPDAPQAFFILDESVLWRQVGNQAGLNEVMIEQLEHLKFMASHANVTIQFASFREGAYRGLRGPFVLLEFEADDGHLLYRENFDGQVIVRDDAETTAPYFEEFTRLEGSATPPEEVIGHLDFVIDAYRQNTFGIRLAQHR